MFVRRVERGLAETAHNAAGPDLTAGFKGAASRQRGEGGNGMGSGKGRDERWEKKRKMEGEGKGKEEGELIPSLQLA